MKGKHLFLFSLFTLIILSFPSFMGYAEKNDFEFRIEPIFPESQIGNEGYYQFKGSPNSAITLQARVINESEKELTVGIRGLNAYSGKQGIIYQEKPILEGTAVTNEHFQFNKVVSSPSNITLGPLESKVVDFTVNIPDITGTLLGSMEFRVFQGTEEITEGKENSQLLIDQYKAINLGVQVDVNDYTKEPSLTFESPYFSPEQIAFMLPVKNQHPVIISNIYGTYQVTSENDESFSLKGDIPPFKMAPLTTFHYPISWSDGELKPGTYHITSTLDVNGNTQTYKQTVSIKNKELNETQEMMEKRGEIEIAPKTFPWAILIIALLLVIVVILLWKIKRPKRRKDRMYPGKDPNST